MGDHIKETQEERDEQLSTADMVQAMDRRASTAERRDDSTEHKESQLLAVDRATNFRSRWDQIQTSFVDEPRKAVEQADALVAEVMQDLARLFADERKNLEGQWGRGDNVSTEDLRIALQRYRTFFSKLLSV